MTEKSKIVSFEDEPLILVDDDDNVLGWKSKQEAHDGGGILHRAFSIFIFNSKKELLLQKRHQSKRLWPLIWSNSCCSHPRKGESYEFAVMRRLKEELGLETRLKYLYKFKYHARYKNLGSEFELCSVYIGSTDNKPEINETEIADWKYLSKDEINRHLDEKGEEFSPWFKMEWKEIQDKYWNEVESITA